MKPIIKPPCVSGLRQIQIKKDEIFIKYENDLKRKKGLNIAILCCPDYSFKVSKNGWAEYDHKIVGYGPGMLCLAYTTALVEIMEVAIIKYNSNLNVYLFYGDNEANDQQILNKIGLSKKEFIQRIRCSQMSGRQHYENTAHKLFDGKAKNVHIKSFGMTDIFYTERNLELANEKFKLLPLKDLINVKLNRKPVLTSLYGKKYLQKSSFLMSKVKSQIIDRLVVGTYFDTQISNGQSWYLLSISANSLIPYFNFNNTTQVPIFNLGK